MTTTKQSPPYTNGASAPTLDDLDEDSRVDPIFKPYTLQDWLKRPSKTWLIDRILGPGDLVQIYGAPASGKTFVVLDLLFSACTGGLFAGRFGVDRSLTCAYCMSEGQDGMSGRLVAAAQHYEAETLPNLFLFELVPQLFDDKDAESINTFAREWKEGQDRGELPALDILVIDTHHGATVGADENSAKDMGKVLQALRLAAKLLGCAIILVHHATKNGDSERGSSALRGAMACMIRTEQIAGKYSLSCEKLKDAEAWKPQTFDLVAMADSVYVWWDVPSDGPIKDMGEQERTKKKLLQILSEYPGTWLTAARLGEAVDKSENYTRRLLNGLFDAGHCKRTMAEASGRTGPRPWVYSCSVESDTD